MNDMELKLVSEKENPLFSRKEIVYDAPSAPTPSRDKIADAVALAAKCSKDCVVIDRIEQKFGSKRVKVYAKAYKSAADAKKHEMKFKFARLERSAKKKEPKAAA